MSVEINHQFNLPPRQFDLNVTSAQVTRAGITVLSSESSSIKHHKRKSENFTGVSIGKYGLLFFHRVETVTLFYYLPVNMS